MPGPNETMETRKQRVGEILSQQTRVPQNLDRVERKDRERYSVESTRSEVQFIDELLNLPASVRMEFSDKELFRLQAIQGRNLSHMLINDRKFGGDSPEMELVKTRLEELEKKIAEGNWYLDNMAYDDLGLAYQRAIAACQAYCDTKNPTFEKGIERKNRVQATLDRLKEESRQIAVAKEVLRNKTDEERQELHIADFNIQDLMVYGKEYLAKYDDPLAQMNTKDATGVHALTFDDFAALIGTYNRGEVEFKDGKLNIINNSYLKSTSIYQGLIEATSNTEKTVANRQMRERLYELVKEKLGDRDPDVLDEVRKELGIADDARKSAAISRKELAHIFTYSAIVCSDVVRALEQGRTSREQEISEEELTQRHAQHRLAMVSKQVFEIGGTSNDSLFLKNEHEEKERVNKAAEKTKEVKQQLKDETDEKKKEQLRTELKNAEKQEKELRDKQKETESQKQQLRDKINEILQKGKKLGVQIPSLSQHQMDNLVNGGLVLVRDQVFSALNQVYQRASHLNGGKRADFNKLAAQNEVIDKIAALALTRYAMTSDTGKELADFEMEELIRKSAFSLAGKSTKQKGKQNEKPSLEEIYDKMYIGELAGQDGVEYAVARRLPECKAWKNKKYNVLRGTDRLKSLCKNMKIYGELRTLALQEGLSADEAEGLIQVGRILDIAMDVSEKSSQEELAVIATELKGTRFATGYAQIKKLVDQKFSFEAAARVLADATRCQKVKRQEQPVNAVSQNTEDKLVALDKNARKVADVLLLIQSPVSLIKKSGDANAKSLIRLKEVLRTFPANQVYMKDVRIGDLSARMVQKADGSLHFVVNGQAIPLTRDAYQLADLIDNDIMEHSRMYGKENTENLMKGLDISGENEGAKMRARILLVKYLAAETKQPETFYTNISLESLKALATDLLKGERSADHIIAYVNVIDTADFINGQETRALVKRCAAQKEAESQVVFRRPEQVQEEENVPDWTKDQKKVQTLITELIFSQETWETDDKFGKPEERMKDILLKHGGTLLLLLDKPELIDEMLQRLPFPEVSEKEKGTEKDIRAQINGKLKEFLQLDEIKELRKDTEGKTGFAKAGGQLKQAGKIAFALGSKEAVDKLKELDQSISKAVSMSMNDIQGMIYTMANELFAGQNQASGKEEEFQSPKEAGITKEESERRMQVSKEKLQSILDNAAKGSEGQGLFIKKVLQNYFANENVNMSVIDQRAMLASALLNVKPLQQLPEDAAPEKKEKAKRVAMGNFMGGFLKGAGPLLQKMLQGMPDSAMPEELRGALKDMKSNLAPIPEKIVRAQLQSMIDRSEGKITKIEVTRALGAASVGQTFLCKMYGPGIPEDGTDVVVKLLRPNVRNRMLREKKLMLYCAKLTDDTYDLKQKKPKTEIVAGEEKEIMGGMEATYLGQLARYEEELDLTIEARNAKKGVVYDEGYNHVKAMKLNNLVEPTTNALVLERASGTTVDKYLDETKKKQESLLSQFYVKDEEGKPQMEEGGSAPKLLITEENVKQLAQVREQMTELLKQTQKRQEYLLQLTDLWVREGIYGQGFYHGDLHAGNIMVDDSGLTVIDFGNATKLTPEQQAHVTRMMMAAYAGDVELFRGSFHKLLENTPESKYQEKREALTKVFSDVFRLGDSKSAGARIAAALLKAQTLGIELPAVIFNFSQCQIRLQNTVDDMNKRISSLQEDIKRLDRMSVKKDQSNDVFRNLQSKVSEQAVSDLQTQERKKQLPNETKIADHYANEKNGITDITEEQVHKQLRDNSEKGQKFFDEKYFNKQKKAVDAPDAVMKFVLNLKTETDPKTYTISADGKPSVAAQMQGRALTLLTPIFYGVYYDNRDEFANVKNEIDDCVLHIHEEGTEQRVAAVIERIKGEKLYQEIVEELQPLNQIREAQKEKKITPAELEKMELELSKKLVKAHHKNIMTTGVFKEFRESLLSDQEDVRAAVEANMKTWFADTENFGAELKVAYDAFRAAETVHAEEFEMKLDEFMDVYQKAVISRLTQMENNFRENTVDLSSSGDFMDAMSDVISDNVSSCLSRMGWLTAKRQKNRMEQEAKEEKQREKQWEEQKRQKEQQQEHQKNKETIESIIMEFVMRGETPEELQRQREEVFDAAAESQHVTKEEMDEIMERALRLAAEKQVEKQAEKQGTKQPEQPGANEPEQPVEPQEVKQPEQQEGQQGAKES